VALRDRLRGFLAPEVAPEPLVRYRTGAPALRSFAAFLALLGPLGGVLFAVADSDALPRWIVPLAIGLPAFACAFFLPRRRRRLVAMLIVTLTAIAIVCLGALVLLFLYWESQCPPDAYECPF
jgi:hypothetical protein